MPKPKLKTRCVANNYAGPDERIVEFSSRFGRGLIALRERPDGRLQVDLYHLDATVDVGVPTANLAYERDGDSQPEGS
jgi:hypothetical protein